MLLRGPVADAQSIGGVINTYARILSIDPCENALLVNDSKGFAAGDRVLIIQVTGASVDHSNSPAFGTITDYTSVGNFELATIASVPTATTVRLVKVLANPYTPSSGIVQLVRIPQYGKATVTSTLQPKPWSAASGTGGIVALVADSLVLNSSIDASGCGFRGGVASTASGSVSSASYTASLSDGVGAEKGESIATLQSTFIAARGANANGGGGGNSHNAGGGGGSNLVPGGHGGNQVNDPSITIPPNDVGGVGGYGLDSRNGQRIFLGGGGGGGEQNDRQGTDGSAGGGIVLVLANTIIASNDTIRANGDSAKTSLQDGAGGGGGGGTVIIQGRAAGQPKTVGQIHIEAYGGKGGNANANNFNFGFGPGGGGSAGEFYSSITPTRLDLNGGKAGIVFNCTDAAINRGNFGASSGSNSLQKNIVIPEGATDFARPSADTTALSICEGDGITIGAHGGSSYLWSPAALFPNPKAQTQSVIPRSTTSYYVTIIKGQCVYEDTVVVTVHPKPSASIEGPSTVCLGSTQTYHISNPVSTASYKWQVTNGQAGKLDADSVTVIWNTAGAAALAVTATSDNCTTDSTLTITVADSLKPSIVGASSLCDGDSLVLTTDVAYDTYLWSTGETTRSIVVRNSGSYFVHVGQNSGCEGTSDNHSVVVYALPTPTILTTAVALRNGETATLTLDTDYTTYRWSTGEQFAAIVVSAPGVYTVEVTNANGCSAMATITIAKRAEQAIAEIVVGSAAANSGEKVTIPITLNSSARLDSAGADSFYYRLRFDRSLLMPTDPSLLAVVTPTEKIIEGKGWRPSGFTSGTLTELHFIAALGDSDSTVLSLDTFYWRSQLPPKVTLQSGLFTLTNVCPASGNRLFVDNGIAGIVSITPNPARSTVTIDLQTIEQGGADLEVVDVMGKLLIHRTIEDIPGEHTVTLDVSSLKNGMYYCRLRTPSAVFHQSIAVYH